MGARLHDHRDDDRPADPSVDVDVPDPQPSADTEPTGNEPDVDEAPGEQAAS